MSLKLKALYADVVLPLHDTELVLGRSRHCEITATTVSRHACTVSKAATCARLTAAKTVYVERKGTHAIEAVQQGATCQLSPGDIVYLAVVTKAAQEPSYQYGLQLMDHIAPASSPETAIQAQPMGSSAGGTATQAPQPEMGDTSATLPAEGCFNQKHIVFWLSAHTALLRQKLLQAGAVLEDSITSKTNLVIAAKNTSITEAASHLTMLPASVATTTKKYEGHKFMLPVNIRFVTAQYISDCLAQDRLLPTASYEITLQQIATQDTRTYSQDSHKTVGSNAIQSSIVAPQSQSEEQRPLSPAEVAARTTQQASSIDAVTPASKKRKLADQADAAKEGAAVATPGHPPEKIGIYPKIDPKQRSFTGGSTGIVWGTGNIWEEPWEQETALATIRKIERHWHQLDNRSSHEALQRSPADAAGLAEEGSGEEDSVPSREPQAGAGANMVCNHIACSAQQFCVVEQLQTVRDNYRGRVDQFRIKAVERAISEIIGLTWPLRKDADVARLTMGAKSKDKVLEILQTGTLRRNEAMADDEHQQVIQLFLKVWGAAEATCERWYAAGCRTLDDLRARTDLSEQQVAGLNHFDDMQQRISRAEVELVHGIVCEAVSQLLQVKGQADADRLHCRVTGSYIRGKPMTGDIDFLILPPPSRSTAACGPLLQALLSLLLQQGLLLNEMSPERPRPHDSGSATWLGLCKPPGSAYVRRIDFKVYPTKYIAFAVNYFIGSGPFVRALRYWANTATGALAQQMAPSANGFKLTDTVLVPMIRQPKQRTAAGQVKSVDVLVPPGMNCTDETQIFEALGLAYVPPYMRYFGTNYQ